MEGGPPDRSDRPAERGWLPPEPPGPPPELGHPATRPPDPPPRELDNPATRPPVPPPPPQPQPPHATQHQGWRQSQPAPAQYGGQQQGWQQPPQQPGWAPTAQQTAWQQPHQGQPAPPGWQAPPPGYGQHAWLPPPGWYPQPVDTGPGNGQAVAGFILALSAAALLAFSFGLLFIFALPCAVLAIVFGRKGRARVDAGETAKHRGIAQAGFVIGVVTLILSLLSAAGWIAVIASDEDFFEDLEDQNNDLDSVSAALVLASRIGVLLTG